MAQEVVMPQMGESITEGTITTWLKKVGDAVERDEPLFEISTDKVDAEIPSPVAGTLLEIKVQSGETVPIETVVAVIGEAAEKPTTAQAPAEKSRPTASPSKVPPAPPAAVGGKDTSAASQADGVMPAKKAPASRAAPPAPNKQPAAPPDSDAEETVEARRRTKSSPVVRKIASEHGVDISSLTGTGISGRVTKSDILTHLQEDDSAAAAPPSAASATGPAGRSGGAAAHFDAGVPDAYRARVFEGDKVEELNTMRTKIAQHMVASRRISAHVGTVWEMDFSHVGKLRAKHKAAWQEKYGVNLTYTAFIMKAAVEALKAFPIVNASLDDRKVIYHRDINLGLAVALDWGLIVPVVHQADELNLLGLARRSVDLATRARSKKLKPEEVQAGTFTITNPGIYGPMFGIPVINQPQVAIMGVGAVEKRPVVIDDMIAIRTRAYLSLSFDHRLIDGAIADQFMARVKKGIEEFDPGEL